ncbi:MAG: RNA polymerase sigma factor [Flavobacteriales bacterium]
MDMQKLSDRDLVNRYVSGEETAFEVLMERHKDRVYSHIYMMVRSDQLAEDIFQDTFIKVVRTLKKGRYNEEGKFLSWVIKIAHNLVIDHFRRERKMRTVHGSEENDIVGRIEDDADSAEDSIIQGRNKRELRKLIVRLPMEQREVLVMRQSFKMSFKEIAARTEVSINTSLGRMRYALINLRKMIEQDSIPVSPH